MAIKLRVLIAEDERVTAEVLRELVEQEGHTVCGIVCAGEDILSSVLTLRPDVVLMDVHLAGKVSGVEATRDLLQQVSVPVLVISGTDSPEEMREIAKSGALGFIKKPVSAYSLNVNLRLAAHQNAAMNTLKASEYLHRSIFDNAAVGIYVCHPGGHYMACNQAFARILGYADSAELLRLVSSIDEQIYVESGRREELLETLRQGRAVRDFESRVYGKDGDYVWIAEHVAPHVNADGTLEYYEGVVVNITERVRAREAEAVALALARTTIEAIADCVAVTDLDRNIIITNKAFEEEIGAGLGDDRVIRHTGGAPDVFALFLEKASAAPESPLKVEGRLLLAGIPVPFSVTITPYRTAAGEIVGAVFVIRRS